MRVEICASKQGLHEKAAQQGAERIREAIRARGEASVVLASGTSQIGVLERLATTPDIDWRRVTGFHLDEYVGLPMTHPASFGRYMWERFVKRLPIPLRAFHFIETDGDAEAEARRLGGILARHPIDVAFAGIGENGHIAFAEPPADFQTEAPYLVVDLTLASRLQQVGEGWFTSVDDVPRRALTMSVRQIMKSAAIVCVAPELRKAGVVRAVVEGPVTPLVPASILQRHAEATLVLDPASASLLRTD